MFLRGISMRKLLEVLRLHFENKLSQHKIEAITTVSRKTISRYLKLFTSSGLTWPLASEYQDETSLSIALNPNYKPAIKKSEIDFIEVSKELRKNKSVTLRLLWEERLETKTMPYSYTHFVLLYRTWLNKQPNSMRQVHKGGDKVFVDYSGNKVTIIDTDTGELRTAEIFVGVMGASSYIYLEATWTQQLSDWIMSHVRLFEHLGGCPKLVIPDNLKSGVLKAHRYDPDITPAYYHMLAHYRSACMPARVRRPKDKSQAENGVLIIQRWVLASLRHEKIYGLADLNARLRGLMNIANSKKFQRFPETRHELFEQLDKPALLPLPKERYIHRDYKKCRVSNDYHVVLDGHYYSVPYTLIGKEIDVWYNSSTVECCHQNVCVAKHIRSNEQRGKTTEQMHMAPPHRAYAALTPDKMRSWAHEIGAATSRTVEIILRNATHDEIGCRKSHDFLNLSKKYSQLQLETACSYAFANNIYHYEYLELIIKQQLNKDKQNPCSAIPLHDNIRGSEYYH